MPDTDKNKNETAQKSSNTPQRAGASNTQGSAGTQLNTASTNVRLPGRNVPGVNDGIAGGAIRAETPKDSAGAQVNTESKTEEQPAVPAGMARRDKTEGGTKKVTEEYFDSAKNLTDMIQTTADDVQGHGGRTTPMPGRAPIDVSRGVTVGHGAGKNEVSRRGQQSSESESDGGNPAQDPNEEIRDQNGNLLGTRGELEADAKAQWSAGFTEDELAAMKREADVWSAAGIKSKEEAARLERQMGRETLEVDRTGRGDFGFATPMPDAVDESHLPAYLRGKDQRKSPAEIEAERKRQVGLENENKRQYERVIMDEKDMVAAGKRRTTDGRITPNPDDGTSNTTSSPSLVPDIDELHPKGDPADGTGTPSTPRDKP